MPRIEEVLDNLEGNQFFSTIDLKAGYWQIPIAKKDRSKTAFSTRSGQYQFRVLPFGLCNAPASFQRAMNILFSGLNWKQCLIYLDDIIVLGKNEEDHLKNLKQVFNILKQSNLKINISKCRFGFKSLKYLGHIIDTKGIRADPEKIEAIKNCKIPTNIKELNTFLGMASCYSKFIKNFSTMAAPLNQQKSKKKLKHSEKVLAAIQNIKKALMILPKFNYPNFKKPFTVYTDASNVGVGAVLEQDHRPIYFSSKTLSKSERNYSTTKRERLAILWAIRKFRPYILGNKTTIVTDHKPLLNLKKLTGERGILLLGGF